MDFAGMLWRVGSRIAFAQLFDADERPVFAWGVNGNCRFDREDELLGCNCLKFYAIERPVFGLLFPTQPSIHNREVLPLVLLLSLIIHLLRLLC